MVSDENSRVMSEEPPAGALTVDAVLDWLPERRIPVSQLGAVLDQDVEHIRLDVGTLTADDDGEWLTTLYVTDTEREVIHAVGWDLEGGEWVAVGSWVGDEYDPGVVEEAVVEWTETAYPDSSFNRRSAD